VLQIGRIVHVHCDSGQVQNDAWLSRRLCDYMMRLEAVITEAEWKQVRWTAKGGIRAASIASRHQHASFGWCVLIDILKFPGFDQRNVGGNHKCAFFAMLHATASGHFDGPGLPGIVGIGDHFKLILGCQLCSVRIAGDDANLGTILPTAEGCQHVRQHRLRQFGS
jgi:hypothetical protein